MAREKNEDTFGVKNREDVNEEGVSHGQWMLNVIFCS